MPYVAPSIATLISRIQTDLQTAIPGADATLRRMVLNALANSNAGVASGLYGYLVWISQQVMPDSAESEQLDRWSTIWGIYRKAATFANGSVSFTGSATLNPTIPAGTLINRSDGAQYSLDADMTLAAGAGTGTVTAVTAGAAGNTAAAAQLKLAGSITGVDSTVTVGANGLTGGADIETDAELLARLLRRIQQAPHGGNANDYVSWALEVAGVTRAWCYPREMGLGTVTVRFMMDDVYASTGGIPLAADVANVLAYLESVCPVHLHSGYGLYVAAPIAAPLNPTILPSPNNATTQAAVQAQLADLLLRNAVPAGQVQVDGTLSNIGGLLLTNIQEAVKTAAGITDYTMSSPNANVASATGEIVTLGNITWA